MLYRRFTFDTTWQKRAKNSQKTQLTYKTALFGPSTPENATQEQQTQHLQLGLPEDLL